MRDPRVEALAQILVGYSTKVKKGDVCVIQGTTAAEPLVQCVYEEVLKAGGLPILQLTPNGAASAFYELAADEQLDWVPPTAKWTTENCDVRIAIMSEVNTRELSQADPKKQSRAQKARKPLMETSMKRAATGEYRWALTLFPTHAHASEAGLPLNRYEDFYYAACLATDEEPVTAWQRQSDEVNRLAEWIQGKEEVHVQAPGTDIKLNVSGRTWIPCVGEHNMPDGEFFTGPVEDSVEGEVAFSFPTTYAGREVGGVVLRFEGGKVVDASAQQGEAFLHEMLDTDDGARRLGELGIGTNYGITTGTKEILLDEKIGGTVHMAVGMSYPETGGSNDSAVHWDMICDLRDGGSITVDGTEIQRDGRFPSRPAARPSKRARSRRSASSAAFADRAHLNGSISDGQPLAVAPGAQAADRETVERSAPGRSMPPPQMRPACAGGGREVALLPAQQVGVPHRQQPQRDALLSGLPLRKVDQVAVQLGQLAGDRAQAGAHVAQRRPAQ